MKKIGVSSTVASQYSSCLLGQSGDILSKISGQQNKAYLDLMKNAMNNASTFNGPSYSTTLNKSYSPIPPTINNYGNALLLDITDSSSIGILNRISNASNYDCQSGDFKFDSWVPNTKQVDSLVSCKSLVGMPNADNSTCSSLSQFSNA